MRITFDPGNRDARHSRRVSKSAGALARGADCNRRDRTGNRERIRLF